MNSVNDVTLSTWIHSSFCAVILNPEVKFRLFERELRHEEKSKSKYFFALYIRTLSRF